jgi:RNA polymerase sigma factor (sigma-70 family)
VKWIFLLVLKLSYNVPVTRYTVTELIDGLRRRDNRVLAFIYKTFYPPIVKFILTNSGTEEDAKDIFQEALIVVFRNIKEKSDFKLESGFQTYLYSIARLLWLKHLRDSRNQDRNLKENHPYIEFEEPKPFNEEDIRYSVYQRAFLNMPPDCQNILKMSVDGISQKEIAEKLGFKSENYIKKR